MTTYNGESTGISDTAKYRIVFENPDVEDELTVLLPPNSTRRYKCKPEEAECANCKWYMAINVGWCDKEEVPFTRFDLSAFRGHGFYCNHWEAKE